jgi:phage gp29-like protein
MADDQKPVPQPSLQEASQHGKGDVIPENVSIGTTLGGFVEYLTPTDSVLKQKGGSLAVYKEVLRDDQVKSVFEQRRRAVVSADWIVEPGADDAASKAAADALTENLDEIGWDRITDRQLYGIFYGYSVAEIMWEPRDNLVRFKDIKVRDRSRFVFDREHHVYLKVDERYERMPDRKFWTVSTGADHDDEPYGLGLGHWLYWPVWFKRNDIKFWLVFLEKFGQPTPTAKIPAGKMEDASFRAKALNALRAITTDSAVLLPEGVEVDLLEAARSGAADYEGMCKAMDAAIAKIILSQTMTTDNGSSRSQAEVHQGVADKVVKADADLVCESFNNGPVKWWCEWNFPGALPPRVRRITEPPEDLSKRADRDAKIKQLGYEPTEEYVRETYGDGWVKSQNAERMLAALTGGPQGGADDNADFAETALLATIKAINRNDQRALVAAAGRLASQHSDVVGGRVMALLAAAADSQDYSEFKDKLIEMAGEVPDQKAVDKVRHANIFARMFGRFRAQK